MKHIILTILVSSTIATAELPLEAYLIDPSNEWARQNMAILLAPVSKPDPVVEKLEEQNSLIRSQNLMLEDIHFVVTDDGNAVE